ncbi:hypothetical protein [Ramlibacter sp. 2FC]|uniref:hypothetical protein n=1 Tax=Ramlibacter sp. 2FC TaxID=2502188 RepID=UPI0010F5394F|nr:hypothetical protein [Ramlibacter sp. 2FC]
MSKLLRDIGKTAPDTLEDLVFVMAKNIEESLITGGAIAGKDYTIHDLYSWAMPFALEVFRDKSKDVSFAIEF